MIIIKQGNLLESTENFILHQVNEQGIMGGGLALQIATLYPKVEKEYKEYCSRNSKEELLGTYCLVGINDNQSIINCFTQDNFNTRYDLLEKVFTKLNKQWGIVDKRTMAIPYKYGCGIATGDWNKVLEIIEKCFTDVDITIYKLKE